MNKFFTTILILTAAAAFQFGFAAFAAAEKPDLEVQFQTEPLFDELDFLPGDSTAKWVKVTNNTADPQTVAVEALNVSSDNDFASRFRIIIKNGPVLVKDLPLNEFLSGGEIELGQVAKNSTAQYDFTIHMDASAEDAKYQEKSVAFDLAIGFFGGDKTPDQVSHTLGYRAGLIMQLAITNVRAQGIGAGVADILWDTNLDSTSRVVFSKEGEGHSFNDGRANFGYGHIYPVPEDGNLVNDHSVGLSGLEACSKYYYVVLSHRAGGGNTSSGEYSFTTLCPQVKGLMSAEEERQALAKRQAALGIVPAVEGAADEQSAGVQDENNPKDPITEFNGKASSVCGQDYPWWLFLLFLAIPAFVGSKRFNEAKNSLNAELKKYLSASGRAWIYSGLLPIGLAVWAYFARICLPWWPFIALLIAALAGYLYDRRKANRFLAK